MSEQNKNTKADQNSDNKKDYKIVKKEEKNSELEMLVEFPIETLEKFRDQALASVKKDIEIDGFRKGQAPDNMVLEHLGEMALWEKMAYQAINNIVPTIIMNEKVNAITMPAISITKISPKSPLEFKMQIALMPTIELPDYKKIAGEIKKEDKAEATDKEVDEYIDYIRKQRAEALAMSKNEKVDKDKLELPELNDEFVQTLGNFKTVDDFKKELKENISKDKQNHIDQKRRVEIIEKIISEAKADIPKILVDEELNKMMLKFRGDIEGMKINFEDYLKEIKKTEDDLRKEWEVDAGKRAKMNLILPKIADAENIKADEKEVEKELEHMLSHHKDLNKDHAKMYIQSVLNNEAVFKFLETL